VIQTETERWLKLASKMKPFLVGFEEFVGSLFSPAITCECETLSYSSVYETISLTLPKEVTNLVKSKLKPGNGDVYPFKLVAQETLGAYAMLERCLHLFRLICGEKEAMVTAVQSKSVMELGHVALVQFFYKYFLRLVNHWNFAHLEQAGSNANLISLERNLLSSISEKVVCGLLGVVLNEVDFLRARLVQFDPSLALQMSQDDRIFGDESLLEEDCKPLSRTSAKVGLTRSSSFRRKGVLKSCLLFFFNVIV
jgi:hypothetical protein